MGYHQNAYFIYQIILLFAAYQYAIAQMVCMQRGCLKILPMQSPII